jgi:hypothetical protein
MEFGSRDALVGVNRSGATAIELRKNAHDFGKVQQHVTLEHSFPVGNRGPSDIEVKNVVTGCACSEVILSPATLGAGETGRVIVRWKTGGRTGPTRDTATVLFVQRGSDKIYAATVVVSADIQPEIVYDPPELVIGRSQASHASVVFKAGTQADSRVLSARPASDDLAVSVDSAGKEVRVVATGRTSPECSKSYVLVETNAPGSRWISVPVRFVD